MGNIKVYDKTVDKMYSSEEYHISLDLTNKVVRINESPLDYEKEIEAILLPPTGVEDINKKESYLGDILKQEGDKESFGIVKKRENNNNMYVEWSYKRHCIDETKWTKSKQEIGTIAILEIVGNIFDSADMIKKEV